MSAALRLSAGANVVLIGALAFLLWRDHATVPSTAGQSESAQAIQVQDAPSPSLTSPSAAAKGAGGKLTPALVAQLEDLGISRSILVSAVLEDFHRRWDKHFNDVQKRYAPKQVPEREYIELARQREAAQVRQLKETLGEQGYLEWDKERTLHLVNGAGLPLTDAEAETLYRLQKEFDEKHKELQMAMEDGIADRADAAALQTRAQEALERELEKVLGKQRLDQMRGYSDPVADVHRLYGDLNPSPDQAKKVIAAEEAYRESEAALARRLQSKPGDAASVMAELKTLNDAREENLRRVFGAEAYDRMKQQNDPTYKTLKQYADAWNLQEREVNTVYQTLQAFHDQADRTRLAAQMSEAAGQPVNWREINAAIDQARQKTEAGLQGVIGGERLRRLKQNGMLTMR